MLNTKHRLLFHSFYDHVGIAAYLEKMAAKGWMLEKIGMFLKFRRTEPKKVHFAVTYFPDASQYDPHPSEKQLELEEFCAMAGWKKVASSAQMQIFCNEEENPVPLETDALTQIDNIHAAVKKDFLKSYLLFIALALWNLWLRFDDITSFPTIYLTDNSTIVSCLNWILLIILSLSEIICYFLWHKKALLQAQESGILLPTHSRVWLQRIIVFMAVSIVAVTLIGADRITRLLTIILVIYMLLVMAAVRGLQSLLKKWDFSAKANKWTTLIVTFIVAFAGMMALAFGIMANLDFPEEVPENTTTIQVDGQEYTLYHDEIPLTLHDLMDLEDDIYLSSQLYVSQSVLLKITTGQHREVPRDRDTPCIDYRIIETPGGLLYGYMEDHLVDVWTTEGYATVEEIDPAPWGANAAYRRYTNGSRSNIYIICWDHCILEFAPFFGDDTLPQDLTDEQMAIIAEKLSK